MAMRAALVLAGARCGRLERNLMYKVARMYHPSHRTTSIPGVEAFFRNVFGRESINMLTIRPEPDPAHPEYPRDYSTFTAISDVWFDSIDPTRYVIDGEQRYEDVTESHLHGTGWAVHQDGIEELYQTLVANGIRCTDQANRLAAPDKAPRASFSTAQLFFTLAEDTGLRYEFYPAKRINTYDPRTDPSWTLPPLSEDDPLGIEFCSHHTVLTTDLPRATRLLVDILGGVVLHETHDDLFGTDSTFVALADGIFELATPTREGSYTMVDWKRNAPEDTYHAITWKVRDLDRVARHLEAQHIRILAQDDSTLVTQPEDAIGVPWRFTAEVVPGDTRVDS